MRSGSQCQYGTSPAGLPRIADLTTKHGDSAQRVFHNIHHSGSVGGTKLNPGEAKGGR